MITSSSVLNMFAKSPMRPLQQHMVQTNACVQALIPFFEAVFADQWDEAAKIQEEIRQREREADHIKIELRLHLPKGLFLPVSRMDILYLLTKQEDIADTAQDIAGFVLGRHLPLPKQSSDIFMEYIICSAEAVEKAANVVNELDELLEVGFKGKVVELVTDMIHKLNKAEGASDRVQVELRKKIFELEDQLKPVDVIFTYKIIEWIASLSDYAQKVGSGLHILLAR